MDKAALRRAALAGREALTDRGAKSTLILDRVSSLWEFARARLVSAYVGVGAEVMTSPLLEAALGRDVRVAVPWREGNHLRLAAITSLAELTPVSFGLLEPSPALALQPERLVVPRSVEVYLLPGVAFDRRGGRLGHGRGYYDRLLAEAGDKPLRVALAFECQLVNEVPMEPRDQRMDLVVTEAAVYRVSARTASAGP